jgi:hypothetical protein
MGEHAGASTRALLLAAAAGAAAAAACAALWLSQRPRQVDSGSNSDATLLLPRACPWVQQVACALAVATTCS